MPGQSDRPDLYFAGQNVKFTGQLSDDRLLFAALNNVVTIRNNVKNHLM